MLKTLFPPNKAVPQLKSYKDILYNELAQWQKEDTKDSQNHNNSALQSHRHPWIDSDQKEGLSILHAENSVQNFLDIAQYIPRPDNAATIHHRRTK